MKKVLVTGGCGQLAKSFKSLFDDSYKLFVLDKEQLDITNIKQVEYFLKKNEPDIIINLAAMTNVDRCENDIDLAYKINGLSIKNFSQVFKGLFIQVSTDYVFDGYNGPYPETANTNPLSIYGKSKLLGEDIVRDHFKDYLILRTNILFDLSSKASFLSWVIKSLSNGENINVVNDQINNPVSTDDMSNYINFLIEKKMKGIFHIGSDTLCSRYEFACMIAETWNLDIGKIKPISTKDLSIQLDSYLAERPLNSGLITEFLDMPTISLKNSLIKLSKSN